MIEMLYTNAFALTLGLVLTSALDNNMPALASSLTVCPPTPSTIDGPVTAPSCSCTWQHIAPAFLHPDVAGNAIEGLQECPESHSALAVLRFDSD